MQPGKRVEINVVEPYEFELPGGGTHLSGMIKRIGSWPPTLPCTIIQLDRAIVWEGVSGSHLLATPRYEGGTLSEMATREGLTVNANLLPDSIVEEALRFISGRGGDFPGKLYGGPIPEFIAIVKASD